MGRFIQPTAHTLPKNHPKHVPATRVPTATQNVPTWRRSSTLLTSSLREMLNEPKLLEKMRLVKTESYGH